MPHLVWQKSSFSGGGNGECIELAAATPTSGRIHLRESDHPTTIAHPTPQALAGLIVTLKSGLFCGY